MPLNKSFVVPNGLTVNSTTRLNGDLVVSGGNIIGTETIGIDNLILSVSGNNLYCNNNEFVYTNSDSLTSLSASNALLLTAISGVQNRLSFAEVTGVSGTYTQISSVPLASTNKVVWELVAINESDITSRYASTVVAIHNGSTGISWTEHSILKTGTQHPIRVRVTNDGTNMYLEVSE